MNIKFLQKLAGIALVLFFSQGMAQVSSDYDKSTDFSKYHTYYFEGWQKDSDKLLNDLDKKRILESFKAEFAARGMTPVADKSQADATILLYLVLDKKTSTTAYTDFTGGMGYGPRWGFGMGGIGMGTATTTYSQNDYVQGTMVVDLYDASTKKLIWQGISKSVVQAKAQKRDKTIPKKVKKLMNKFPVAPKK
ncbi:DUF4136 domain-containing protein [Flavobacteriaceae bacterium F89]|uniref:DUF4136 domain-containing protein n=1 Tax=Cerina litoralis TaxID=2874477 RepID=A0AAE3ESR2_9FLAO|nr:DUF4136 domain-containing protein [Cerina litoralis]MCG2460268.1 DUF4136 domain-containing protein [Cerina litoralis]